MSQEFSQRLGQTIEKLESRYGNGENNANSNTSDDESKVKIMRKRKQQHQQPAFSVNDEQPLVKKLKTMKNTATKSLPNVPKFHEKQNQEQNDTVTKRVYKPRKPKVTFEQDEHQKPVKRIVYKKREEQEEGTLRRRKRVIVKPKVKTPILSSSLDRSESSNIQASPRSIALKDVHYVNPIEKSFRRKPRGPPRENPPQQPKRNNKVAIDCGTTSTTVDVKRK